jgi:hypothetical protein
MVRSPCQDANPSFRAPQAILRALPSLVDEVGVMLLAEEARRKLRPAA